MNQTELRKLVNYKKPHKYGAVVSYCKLGHRHPSKAEAIHCWSLQAQINQGLIKDLEYEKPYELLVPKGSGKNLVLICTHKPDFTYKRFTYVMQVTGKELYVSNKSDRCVVCVDEVKGMKTPDWIIKSKLFQALYPEIEYRIIQ